MRKKSCDLKDASSTQTADMLGITRQHVSKLCSQGILKNNGKRGRYDVPQAIKDYAAYIVGNGGGDAQTRLIIARTEKIELQNRITEQGLISIDDAKRVLTLAFEIFQTLSANLPKETAPKVAKARTATQVRGILEKEFETARAQIGNELMTVCGLDPKEGVQGIKARLRRLG